MLGQHMGQWPIIFKNTVYKIEFKSVSEYFRWIEYFWRTTLNDTCVTVEAQSFFFFLKIIDNLVVFPTDSKKYST